METYKIVEGIDNCTSIEITYFRLIYSFIHSLIYITNKHLTNYITLAEVLPMFEI